MTLLAILARAQKRNITFSRKFCQIKQERTVSLQHSCIPLPLGAVKFRLFSISRDFTGRRSKDDRGKVVSLKALVPN